MPREHLEVKISDGGGPLAIKVRSGVGGEGGQSAAT